MTSSGGESIPASEFVLRAKNLSAGLGASLFVRGVDMGVRRGEVVALLGANGSGKTTTLMALAGAARTMEGEVEFLGERTNDGLDKRARKGLAVITQERCVFMKLTVHQNLLLGRGSVDDALAIFPELTDHMARKVGLLSGGQQQMLAVARALASGAQVLLADEVTLGLAPRIATRLLQAIRQASHEAGLAVILVEQHVHKALSYSDRACVLQRGRLRLSGDSSNLLQSVDELRETYL